MPFRFRRGVRVAPGLRLTLGTRGLSASFGRRGAHLTTGPSGTKATISAPGTGVSYTTTIARRRPARGFWWQWIVVLAVALALARWWFGWS
jgi:hypothetical protein